MLWAMCAGTVTLTATDVYVSVNGSDDAGGGISDPVATLAEAVERVRERREPGSTIWMGDGIFTFDSTVELDALDSGSAGAPLTIAALGRARPILVGGRKLDPDSFRVVETYDAAYPRLRKNARQSVMVCQIGEAAKQKDGGFVPRGFANRQPGPMELFVDGHAQDIAGWPNARSDDPAAGIVNGFYIAANKAEGDRSVQVANAPLDRWRQSTESWAHGYWDNDWADDHLKVAAVDPGGGTLTFASGASFGFGTQRPFRVYNLPEELDSPGEYWIDADAGLLYFWPPADWSRRPVYVSELRGPILRLRGTRHVVFRGLTFDAARDTLVEVRDSVDVTFDRCTFRNSGTTALILDGRDNVVSACEFESTGAGAIYLGGGERKELLRGNNLVINSFFHDLGRVYLHNSVAVQVAGVGNEVRNNLIVRLPHAAIQFNGNLHRISGNEIVAVCNFSDDAGAIYTGRDWVGYGNVVEGNIIRDIRTRLGTRKWVHGVYLDDCASGTTVRGNIFYGIDGAATNVGGGRSNIIENNVIALCGFSGHVNDNRGLKWANNKPGDSWNLLEQIDKAGARGGLWPSLFPELASTPRSWRQVRGSELLGPKGSVFARNIGWGNKQFAYEQDWGGRPDWIFGIYKEFGNNADNVQPLFRDADLRVSTRRDVVASDAVKGFTPLNPASAGLPVVYAVDASGQVAFEKGSFAEALAQVRPVQAPASKLGRSAGPALKAAYYTGVAGASLDDIPPEDAPPAFSVEVEDLSLPRNVGDNYAVRLRGYIVPPASGHYTFWLAGDDFARLSVSENEDPAGAHPVATLPDYSNPDEWERHPGQKSEPILLRINRRYYFELLMKEVAGNDFAEVAWAGPRFGRSLLSARHVRPLDAVEQPAHIVAQAAPAAAESSSPAAPQPGRIRKGYAKAATWAHGSGDEALQAQPAPPGKTFTLRKLESVNRGEQFTLEVAGYIVPQVTGEYRFWVSGDDRARLELSTDARPTGLRTIAFTGSATRLNEFDSHETQESSAIRLEAGQPYYFRARLEDRSGPDHLQVAWEGPGFSRRIIDGDFLGSATAPWELGYEGHR